MAELLLELLSEEIPARMQRQAADELWLQITSLLDGNGVSYHNTLMTESRAGAYFTPRRIVAHLVELSDVGTGSIVRKRGPRQLAPEQAIAGFRRSVEGLTDNVSLQLDEKGEPYWFALIFGNERTTIEILAEGLPRIVAGLPWPKSMRWGTCDFRWVRPLQSMLCLLDGKIVPFEVAGIASSDWTRGHRFMAPEPFAVRDFADYRDKLRAAKVILDGAERRAIIARGAEDLAASHGLMVADDPVLLDEVSGLVEWPVPLLAAIDEAFMTVPAEALVTTMRNNQKYLALRTEDEALARQFVVVANIEATDGGAAIVTGNERVLRARLWDAKFFWDQDRKVSLESRLPALEYIVFHAQLGSLRQRVERLVALSSALLSYVPGADRILTERAALLAKADLVTGMVGEFPELQGIMGSHYAAAQGEHPDVSQAIREQYSPRGSNDICPTLATSVVLAMADKLDSLVGLFSIDVKPSGSKDPYALRRAALGIVSLILTNNLRLSLRRVVEIAHSILIQGHEHNIRGDRAPPPLRYTPSGLYGRATAFVGHGPTSDFEALSGELILFLIERLQVQLRERGIRHDVIGAVVAAGGGDDLVDLTARAEALQSFLATEDGRNLLTAFRRASNIVAIEEKRDGRRYDGHPVPGALAEPAEEILHAALESAASRIETALAAEDYAGAMSALAALREPVDGFFSAVMVNVAEPDLRLNRLLLLSRIRSALQQVADFSLIEDAPRGAAAA